MVYSTEGVIFSCTDEGRIKEVFYNGLNIRNDVIEGKLFPDFFQSQEISKAIDFLVQIKKDYASFGWELFFKPEISKNPFYFSGALMEDDIFIFGSRNKIDFDKFISGMMLLNNEQINKIRALEKHQSESDFRKFDDSSKLFDEISRLNNELVDTQRELTKKNAELAELNKLKNQFIGMAAHDLRNPLGNIFNFAEFLESEKESLTAEQSEFISHIKNQSSFMLNLVNDLLDVSAIESGNVSLTLEHTDIVALVKEVINLDKALAQKKNISVDFNSKLKSSELLLDKQKFKQVITNLFTNAVKYSNENTRIKIELFSKEDCIYLSVTDEGQGIPQNELDQLFKPFQKTSSRSTAGEKSVGLGLFIVKRIVEAHSGKIWAESEVGRGTTFFVRLQCKVEN